jgi:hypothetical protein
MVPGILVALKTYVRGGVDYERSGIEEDAEGRVKKWETTRTMADPDEHKRATETASKASSMISRLCVRTTFGLLCRSDREGELDAAVAQVRQMTMEWNRKAVHSFVYVNAIKGRIADNDEEATRAILNEVSDLFERMNRAIAAADVTDIRATAMQMKRLTAMTTPSTSGVIERGYTAAREAAKAIVKRGEDLSDRVANVKIEIEQESFNDARVSFLDTMASVMPDLPSIDVQRGVSLEVDDTVEVAS